VRFYARAVPVRARRLTSAGAALIAAIALLAALWQLPDSLRSSQERIDANAPLSAQDRELEPARANSVHGSLAVRAAEVIPEDGVYYVATGGQPGSDAAPSFYAYWLLPRRQTSDLGAAGWVVSFGADPAKLGVPTDVVVDMGGGAEVLRVRR
jgi:hypothetical protein